MFIQEFLVEIVKNKVTSVPQEHQCPCRMFCEWCGKSTSPTAAYCCGTFACLFVCLFVNSQTLGAVEVLPYYGWDLCYPLGDDHLNQLRQADPILFVCWILTPPLVGCHRNSLFRALVGCRMADSADHVPLLSSAFAWLLCRPEDLGSSVWSPIAQLPSHGCLTLNLWL